MAVNPQCIHPQLWRASQLSHPCRRTVASGHTHLDACLPGGGWPTGSLIEILLEQPAGVGEIHLLKPALGQADHTRSLVFLNPPHMPSALCLQQWFQQRHRIYWVRTQSSSDTLWAAEKILQYDATAALLCWVDAMRWQSLRRLHLAAGRSSVLFFCFRPAPAMNEPSAAPLRLALSNTAQGLSIRLVKRRGPTLAEPILLAPQHGSNAHLMHAYASLGQHSFSTAASG